MTEIFTGVRVFDGSHLLDGQWDVTTEDGRFRSVERNGGAIPDGAETVDGAGATLLPGLIDAHVHLRDVEDLRALVKWGVTTALDMGSWASILHGLRRAGSADVRGTGAAAMGPGNPLGQQPGRPVDSVVADADAGRRFVAARVSEGVDYIKIIVDPPGPGGGATARYGMAGP